MSNSSWTCLDTDNRMEAYVAGALPPRPAFQLFQHVMRCDRCRTLRWEPFFEETTESAEMLLDSLIGTLDRAREVAGRDAQETWADTGNRPDLMAPGSAPPKRDAAHTSSPQRPLSPVTWADGGFERQEPSARVEPAHHEAPFTSSRRPAWSLSWEERASGTSLRLTAADDGTIGRAYGATRAPSGQLVLVRIEAAYSTTSDATSSGDEINRIDLDSTSLRLSLTWPRHVRWTNDIAAGIDRVAQAVAGVYAPEADRQALELHVELLGEPWAEPPAEITLSGLSLELPLAIAATSRLLELPVSSTAVFTGGVEEDGRLVRVSGGADIADGLPAESKLIAPPANGSAQGVRARSLDCESLADALDVGGVEPTRAGVTWIGRDLRDRMERRGPARLARGEPRQPRSALHRTPLSIYSPGRPEQAQASVPPERRSTDRWLATFASLPGRYIVLELGVETGTRHDIWLLVLGGRVGIVPVVVGGADGPSPAIDADFVSSACSGGDTRLSQVFEQARMLQGPPLRRWLDAAAENVRQPMGPTAELSLATEPKELERALIALSAKKFPGYLPYPLALEMAYALHAICPDRFPAPDDFADVNIATTRTATPPPIASHVGATPQGPRLKEVGTVLYALPHPEALNGYSLFPNSRGELQAESEEPVQAFARLDVIRSRETTGRWNVELTALLDGVSVDGATLSAGDSRPLASYHVLRYSGALFQYESFAGSRARHGWNAVMYHRGPTYPVPPGRSLVGRDQRGGSIPLRNRQTRANLHWNLEGLQAAEANGRPSPMRDFYLDSYNASREHARLVRSGNTVAISPKRREIFIEAARGDGVTAVLPGDSSVCIESGDRVIIGHQVFGYRDD